jgi:hypothetical protein
MAVQATKPNAFVQQQHVCCFGRVAAYQKPYGAAA